MPPSLPPRKIAGKQGNIGQIKSCLIHITPSRLHHPHWLPLQRRSSRRGPSRPASVALQRPPTLVRASFFAHSGMCRQGHQQIVIICYSRHFFWQPKSGARGAPAHRNGQSTDEETHWGCKHCAGPRRLRRIGRQRWWTGNRAHPSRHHVDDTHGSDDAGDSGGARHHRARLRLLHRHLRRQRTVQHPGAGRERLLRVLRHGGHTGRIDRGADRQLQLGEWRADHEQQRAGFQPGGGGLQPDCGEPDGGLCARQVDPGAGHLPQREELGR